MSKKIGWVSAAIMAAACSGGGGGGETPAPAPDDVGTPPPTAPPAQNMPPVVDSTDLRAQLDGGSISVPINVSDPDGDPVELVLLDAPDWISLNEEGLLTGTPDADQTGSFDISIEASDGTNTSQITLTLTLFMDPVEQALATGDYTYITRDSDSDVPTVLLNEIEATRERNKAALREIYRLNEDGTLGEDSLSAVSWSSSPGSSTFRFAPVFGYNFPIVTTNTSSVYSWQNRKYHFALAGFYGDTRYTVISGTAINGSFNETSQRHQLLKSAIEWSIDKDPVDLNIVIAQHHSDGENSGIRNWLSSAFPDQVSFNIPRACDSIALSICMEDNPDLLVLYEDHFSEQELDLVIPQIQAALESGVPLFFVRSTVRLPETLTSTYWRWGEKPLGSKVQEFLHFSTNNSNQYEAAQVSNASPLDYVYGWEPQFVGTIENLVENIEAESLNFDLSDCTGPVTCEENPDFQNAAGRPLSTLQNAIAIVDENRMDPFLTANPNRYYGAMLLVGDYYRSLTSYPMPKATTSSNDIVRALFGENSTAIYRKYTPAMSDLGSFSRSTFSEDLLEDVNVSLTSATPFKTSGTYALPGETVSVTYSRSDDLSPPIWLQVNSLSDESGDPFRTVNGAEFERPSRVSSNRVQVNVGETIEFASAFGGPIHVYFADDDGAQIDLAFKNVAKHPVWSGPEDTEAFLIDLAADEFDWAEFVRPNFELHSTVENMQSTLNNPRYSDPTDLADAIDTYLRGWQFWLDGKLGPGIPENPDLVAFHKDRRFITDIPTDNSLTHMNSGHAACEEACTGNPYESVGPFDPMSLSDQNVAADRLANSDLRFAGSQNGAINDLYAIHSYFRRYQASGETDDECPALPHEALYERIQAAQLTDNPSANLMNQDFAAPDQQNAIYIQLMTALQNQGALDDGWKFLPRHNHLMHRDSQINYRNYFWEGRTETGLCFDGLGQVEARQLKRNDWLLVTLSCAARYNLTAYLDIWGYDFGQSMRDHVASLELPELEPVFYAIPPTGHCTGLDHPELPIDGVTTWPN